MAEKIRLYPDGEERRRIMDFIMAAGQTLLENGAEVFRAEQTMQIMANSLHLREFHVYVLTNGIFASAGTAEISEVRNVPERTIHLGRVAAVNELSREIAAGQVDLEQAEQQLVAARRIPFPGLPAQILSGAVGSHRRRRCGRHRQPVPVAVQPAAGPLSKADRRGPDYSGLHSGLRPFGGQRQPCRHWRFDDPDPRRRLYHVHPGLCEGGLSVRHHPADRCGPGGGLPGLRHRSCAAGPHPADGGDSGMTGTQLLDLLRQFLLGGIGTLCFGILFGIPRKCYLACAATGAVGWLTYELAVMLGIGAVTANLLAAIPLTLLARIFAVTLKAPVTVFLLCGIFPLVPGAGIYYTAYYFIQNDNLQMAASAADTVKIAAALAIGISVVLGLPFPKPRHAPPEKKK